MCRCSSRRASCHAWCERRQLTATVAAEADEAAAERLRVLDPLDDPDRPRSPGVHLDQMRAGLEERRAAVRGRVDTAAVPILIDDLETGSVHRPAERRGFLENEPWQRLAARTGPDQPGRGSRRTRPSASRPRIRARRWRRRREEWRRIGSREPPGNKRRLNRCWSHGHAKNTTVNAPQAVPGGGTMLGWRSQVAGPRTSRPR